MKLYRTKTDVWYYILVYLEVMAVSLYGDVLPADSKALEWLCSTIVSIKEHQFFYVFNFVLLIVAYVYFLNIQLRRKIFRLSRCLAWGMSSFLCVVCIVKHPVMVDYLCLTLSFLFNAFLIELAKFFKTLQKKNVSTSGLNGFVTDCSCQDNLQDVGWEKYAESLLDRLEATALDDTSFSVALTGKWGTGKSTFLGYLKKELKKKNLNYLEFNPWLSNSAENIVKDFFESLNAKLHELGIELGDEIDDYVRLLFQWGNESFVSHVNDVIGFGGKQDLGSLRSKISEELNELDCKIYIMIDDVDRLQSNEIFEILKLIRNTADFNNIVYVVTFDKEYVIKSLQSLNIAKHEEYLKKIFQMELKFPMFESYLITHLFNEELARHSHYPAELQNQLNVLELVLGQNRIYLVDYLPNFRDAKRLVNEFLLNLDYIVKQGVIDDFNIRDLFLILLLEFTDDNAFLKLKDNLWTFVETYSYDNRYIRINERAVKEDSGFSVKTQALLFVLFPPKDLYESTPKRNSIRRHDKVNTYFSFRPYADQMSLSDFQQLLRSSSDETIKAYVNSSSLGVINKASSMRDMMNEQRLKDLDKNSIENFVTLLVEWTKKYKDTDLDKIGNLYRDILLEDRLDDNSKYFVKDLLNPFFTSLWKDSHDFLLLQKICCKMKPCFVENTENGDVYFPECIYGWNELYAFIINNTLAFLDKVKPSVSQVLVLSSGLHWFIKCSIVYNEYSVLPQFDSFPIQDELIDYFSQKKENNDISVFLDKFRLQNYAGEDENERISAMTKDIVKYFACVPFYVRFLQECFVHENEHDLDEYFGKNRIG